MRTTLRCLAFLALAGTGPWSATSRAAVPPAFDHPSFVGTWVAAPRQELRITQDGSKLSIVRTAGRLEDTLVYQLDGSESRNETRTVLGEKWTHVSKARWVGAAVVITTTTTRESTGGSWDWMATYFLTSDAALSVATLDGVVTSDQVMDLRTVVYARQ